jgi:hypothetical protein
VGDGSAAAVGLVNFLKLTSSPSQQEELDQVLVEKQKTPPPDS